LTGIAAKKEFSCKLKEMRANARKFHRAVDMPGARLHCPEAVYQGACATRLKALRAEAPICVHLFEFATKFLFALPTTPCPLHPPPNPTPNKSKIEAP
jgi:hypothetical protein